MEDFEEKFTFETDCAPTMPKVFGASVSPAKVPYSQRWVGCISHQMNTAMKSAMQHHSIQDSIIQKDLTNLKSLISTFKHASYNDELMNGYKLIQEVSTRFGTTCDVVTHFLKSEKKVWDLMESKSGEAAVKLKNI